MARSCKNCNCNKCRRKVKYTRSSNTDKLPPSSHAIVNKGTYDTMKKGLSLLQSFARSIASRGLTNKKADIAVKQLRVLSCFGDEQYGGNIKRCEHLRISETPGKYYCGECGCGDKPRTWLLSTGEEYSKLDYPKLNCPLNMPGFSNYDPETNGGTRKFDIENYDVNKLVKITVSSPDPPEIESDQ